MLLWILTYFIPSFTQQRQVTSQFCTHISCTDSISWLHYIIISIVEHWCILIMKSHKLIQLLFYFFRSIWDGYSARGLGARLHRNEALSHEPASEWDSVWEWDSLSWTSIRMRLSMGKRLSLTNQYRNETQYGNETTYLTEGDLRSVAGVQRSTKLHIVGITLHNRSCLTKV